MKYFKFLLRGVREVGGGFVGKKREIGASEASKDIFWGHEISRRRSSEVWSNLDLSMTTPNKKLASGAIRVLRSVRKCQNENWLLIKHVSGNAPLT